MVERLSVDWQHMREIAYENRVNSRNSKSEDKTTLSQACGTPQEGAETSGKV